MRALGIPYVGSALSALAALAALAAPAGAAPRLRVLSSDAREVVVEWTADAFEWQAIAGDDAVFRRPLLPGGVYLSPAGQPDVPSLLQMVAVPPGANASVSVLEIESATIAAPDIAPAAHEEFDFGEGEPVRLRVERRRVAPVEGAPAFPAAWAELLSATHVRGSRLVRLALHPVRYDAARGDVLFARRLVVRVAWDGGAAAGRESHQPESADWISALGASVLNPESLPAFRAPRSAPQPRGSGDSFYSAPTWLKVRITSSGIYEVDYFTFANLGFDPGQIDPTSVRVFSGRSRPLDESLAVPRDSFMEENALLDLGDGDAVFETTDRLLFYALGPNGWAAEYDSTKSRTDHLENPYGNETVYWITWGGSFSGPPRRMPPRSVAPDPEAESFAASLPHRVHLEENNVDNYRFRDEDGWWWENLRGRGPDRAYTITLDRVADGSGTVKVRVGSTEPVNTLRTVELKLGTNVLLADSTWSHNSQTALVEITASAQNLLAEGTNRLVLNIPSGTSDAVTVGWFEVEYARRLDALGGKTLHFFSDPANGVDDYLLGGFDATAASIYLFDVTDPHAATRLVDAEVTGAQAPHGLRFSDPNAGPTVRWYAATTMEGVRSLPEPEIAHLRGLRAPQNGADYVVIYHPRFETGASRLAQLRSTLGSNPMSTMKTTIDEIYDEFSWGMKDPTAIRDFLVYARNSWQGASPLYACLIGDASYDAKRYLSGSPENLLPSYTNRYKEISTRLASLENVDFYSTDDFFGYLEPEDYSGTGEPGLDLAIGRYPIADEELLLLQLDKLESYLREDQPGQWQNRMILVADDERVVDEETREAIHTIQVETLARTFVPPAMDAVKIYLTEFPRNSFSKKPEAQAKFIEEFTRGALMVSYTGHGDQNTMSQEEVFVAQKVPDLLNEAKLPTFSTFSCTVSRFDLLSGSSMCELLLALEGGGSVTTFASGALVYPEPSATLHQQWISAMFGTPYVVQTLTRVVRPIGLAALLGKTVSGTGVFPRKNNERYVLLGDPALSVRYGTSPVVFEQETVDSQSTEGLLRVIRGSVVDSNGDPLDGAHGQPAFRGTAFIHVTELADDSGYDFTFFNGAPGHIDYTLDGPTAYRGEVPVVDGRFEAKFFLSEAVPSGNTARVSVFALEDGLDRHGSGAYDSLVIAPTISPQQVSDEEGPRIRLRFEGYESFVDGDLLFTTRPVVLMELEDETGINLRPFPQFARLEAELDGRERVDLAEDFAYTGGTFTRGRVRRIFSLPPGEHTLEVKAFDNVGNRGSTKARFRIVAASTDFDLVDAGTTPYPNPFRDEVDFVFRLTHEADVSLKVFTVSGRRIFEENSIRGLAGENVFHWNGRDEGNGLLSNGTYLYKLEATFRDSTGSETSDEFVGRVVKMR